MKDDIVDGNVVDGAAADPDVYDGDVANRLRRAGVRVRSAALDAQARDWIAERPDRIGFARLAQAHWEITTAAGRFGKPLPADWIVQAAAVLATILTTVAILLIVPHPGSLLTVVLAIAVGPFAGQAIVSGTAWVRRRRAQQAPNGPAPIDDPSFYADLTRRLEACAAATRADRSGRTRAAAADIDAALTWLSAAQGEH